MLYSQDSTNVIRNRLITPKQQEQYARVGLQLIPLAQPASVRIAVTSSRAWSKAQSNSGQMVGQIVGQMGGQIVRCSTNYAPPAGYLPANKYARKLSGDKGKKGEK